MPDAAPNPDASPVSDDASSSRRWPVLLPYIVAIAAQTPLLLYYFKTLWNRPHYQFFPFALIMVAIYAYLRWPRGFKEPFFRRKTSTILFFSGIVFGIAAAMFSEAWFSATSIVMLMTSLFARTKDAEVPGKSLIVLALPLLIILMPPNNLDSTIITTLQQVSASVSSWYLDILNFKHYAPGVTLNFPDQQYEVEAACSGVQSFFTLLFCTAFLVVSMRRPWYRAIPLLVSAAFWAVFMNSIRIMMIPIADILFDLKLITGLPHDLLGYSAMLIAVLMILSTDQLLEFVFGRSSESVDEEKRPGIFGRLTKSGKKSERGAADQQIREYEPVSAGFKRIGLICSLVVLALGSMQFFDFARSMTQPGTSIRAFSTDVLIDLDKKAMPVIVETLLKYEEDENLATPAARKVIWEQTDYNRVDRVRGSDFGQRSDSWVYKSRSGMTIQASIDQTFPGWHELTTCYRLKGWRINSGARIKKKEPLEVAEGEKVDWSYIEVEMTDPTTGRRGLLLFCFTDSVGLPIDAPIEWGSLRSFFERAKNRLFHSLRATLFRGEAYQMQLFVLSSTEFRQTQKEEVRAQFIQVREDMRAALIKYGDDGYVADPVETEDSADN